MHNEISRRSLIDLGLRSVAGAGLLRAMPGSGLLTSPGNGLLAAPLPHRRALVCIYCFGGGDDHVMQGSHKLVSALADLQPLYNQNRLTVIADVSRPARLRDVAGTPGEVMAKTYSALRFLPGGFATLEWVAQAAHVDEITGAGAYTFGTGVSMVAPGTEVAGPWFENARVRELTGARPALRTSFPTSALGRQLEDVTRLIRVGPALGMRDQVFLVGTTGISARAARTGTIVERHRQLAQAMAAFFAATVELGLDQQILTYTDGDFTERSGDRGTRMMLGGSVIGGRQGQAIRMNQDSYAGALASWFGAQPKEVRARFPEFDPSEVVTA
jgi:hypothetical protein